MAFKLNAYNTPNDLSRITSSLTRALIGNAQDDAAIARGKYYDAQTVGQNLQNRGMQSNLDAIDAASGGNIMPRSVARSLGYDVNNGNLIQPVLPGGPQRSVPAMGSDQVNMDGDALMTELSNIARTLFGDGTSNASQVASALDTLGGAGTSRLAESMILSGDNNQAQRGALRLAPQGGQYQNPGFAMTQLRTQDATNRLDDVLDQQASMDSNQKVLEASQYETDARFGEGGQGDRNTAAIEQTKLTLGQNLTAAKERWNNYKANKELEAARYDTDVKAGVARDKNKMADTLARWKHDNREIEMSVEPGKVLVLDPDTGAKLGLSPVNDPNSKYNGLYILDGGKKPGAVTVTVGKGDVYLDQATADALGIPKNNDGKYVIKGAGFKDDASTRDSDGGGDMDALNLQRYNSDWRESLVDYDAFDDVPNNAVAGVKAIVLKNIRKDMKPPEMVNGQNKGGRGLNFLEAYAQNADVILGAGAYKVTTGGTNFFVPKYFFDFFAVGNGKTATENEIKGFFRSDLGYSADQASRVLKEIMAARG